MILHGTSWLWECGIHTFHATLVSNAPCIVQWSVILTNSWLSLCWRLHLLIYVMLSYIVVKLCVDYVMLCLGVCVCVCGSFNMCFVSTRHSIFDAHNQLQPKTSAPTLGPTIWVLKQLNIRQKLVWSYGVGMYCNITCRHHVVGNEGVSITYILRHAY